MQDTTEIIISLIRSIPRGKVSSYGQIAAWAGLPNGARLVSRVLSSCSRKYQLPWHRVLNSQGSISLAPAAGGTEQASLLSKEGIVVENYKVNLKRYAWDGISKS